MLKDLLISIISSVPDGSGMGQLASADALPLTYLCSLLGALVLGRFTGNFGNLTMLLNVSALFIGAAFSNWLFHGIDLPMDHSLHQPLLISMIGMLMAAFAMMWWLQRDNLHT